MSQNEQYEPVIAPQVEKLAGTLVKIGKTWAAHGLNVGKSTLDTYAQTVSMTAEAVGRIKDKVENVGEQR